MSAITLSGVGVAYDGRPAIQDLDLEVAPGGWLGLIGPNGAGKTTILRAVAGLAPHVGRIALDGEPVAGLSPRDVARRIAMVRQEPTMPAGMSVAHYVLLGRSARFSYFGRETEADRSVVAATLERLSLTELATRPLETLSGGERQRAAIARALAQEAPVLLVDEPTSALDLGRQQEVLDLIDAARRDRGLTVVAAMHDLTLAGQYADRLALVVGGRLVQCGPPEDVLTEAAIAGHYRARVRVHPVGDVVRAVVPDRTIPPLDPHEAPREAPPRAVLRAPSVVIVNTGDGKGKSTAAFGTAMRAVARGWSVCVVQFVKSGRWKVGEEQSARRLGIDWWTAGDGFTWDSKDMDRTEAVAREAWRVARDRLASGSHQLVVLDEITYPMNWGWIPVAAVVQAIVSRPPAVNVIATGRDAPEELVACADTVTEMRSVKHAFDRGIRAIRGIEF
ncbi:MAG TPA: cob(I)yrinic acid a,c-diamide adenosyltransferase [Candidatus Dormibacteraeota bacterium]